MTADERKARFEEWVKFLVKHNISEDQAVEMFAEVANLTLEQRIEDRIVKLVEPQDRK